MKCSLRMEVSAPLCSTTFSESRLWLQLSPPPAPPTPTPSLDSPSYAKTKGLAAAVKKWVAAGVPIDGVGSQSHLGGTWPISDVPAAMKLLCADVKECAMTELDIKGATSADYQVAVNACLDEEKCVGITVWGVSDADSWRKGENPLLFDASFKAKAAYNGICSALAQ
jgi:endo-1,4-beta-xylanase